MHRQIRLSSYAQTCSIEHAPRHGGSGRKNALNTLSIVREHPEGVCVCVCVRVQLCIDRLGQTGSK